MKFKPHDYQQHAINFIQEHPRSALLLGMGMGKTITTLTAINNLIYNTFETRQALIIAPLRVARDTWPAEIHKWDHLHNLTTATCIGTPTTRRNALNQNADITIINRENLPWLVEELTKQGSTWPYDMVIIDELSSFKNHKAKRFKALTKAQPHITRMVGLTGTPAPNSLEDLWAPFKLLDGGQRLGRTITGFRDRYFTPGKRNGHIVYQWNLKPGADQEIYNAIADITVSMRTTDYLNLPACTYTNHTIHLTPPQRRNYDELRKQMVTTIDDDTIDAPSAGVLAGKLQQLASGAIYTDDNNTITVHNAKLDALEDIIEAAAGNTILVAYWFKHEATRILERFPQARQLTTAQDMDDWCAGNIPIGLIHPASAGHGLNLQSGGRILVWFTTPWSLELYEQTNARLFRQGQTEPVTITHINAADTIDTQVSAALARKDTTQSALINAVKAQLKETPCLK